MQKAIWKIQWKACWPLTIALCVAAFALPVISVRLGWHTAGANLPLFLTELQLWGLFYPALATVTAILIAAATWMSDRRGQHVYAMLLPMPRWRYVWYRYAAGLMLLLPIVLSLWLGTLVASGGITMPPGLRSYPHLMTFKFALALLVLFSGAFAFAAASTRSIGIGIRIVGLFLAVHVAVLLLAPGTNLLWDAVRALTMSPGPLVVLGGRWMLIDA